MRPLLSLVSAAVIAVGGCSPSVPIDAGGGDAGDGGLLADLAAPRLIAPLSVSRSTSARPLFRWQLAAGADGARIEVCLDRACAHVAATFGIGGNHGAPGMDLPSGVVFWRAQSTASGRVGAPISATWEFVVPRRSAPIASAWGAMFDDNGDGFADVVVGDSDAVSATQKVYVHHGGPGGPSAVPSSVLSAPAPVVLFAASIASAGDVDGDGYADLVVGSPGENAVYLYRGGPLGVANPPSAVLRGPAMSAFGGAVSGAGDVDGDGYADVVVGLPQLSAASSSLQGAAMVLSGGPDGLSMARSTSLMPRAGSDAQGFGQFVATAGDVDGDGLSDVVVWNGIETTDPQELALYRGADKPFGAAPSVLLQYEGSSVDWLGNANLLACAGDVNGDGYTDVVMSSPASPALTYQTDALSIFFGGPGGPAELPSQRVVSPLGSGEHFGLTVAGIDVNGDGVDDLGVSTLSSPPDDSTALVYDGGPRGLILVSHFAAADPSATFEREISSPGDVDGDGFADLVVGYPDRSTIVGDGGELHGAVEVHRGSATGASDVARWTLLPPDTSAVAYGATLAPP